MSETPHTDRPDGWLVCEACDGSGTLSGALLTGTGPCSRCKGQGWYCGDCGATHSTATPCDVAMSEPSSQEPA